MALKIQIIDNKDADHRGLIDFCKGRGYEIAQSVSGKRVIRDVKTEKPDVVFLSLDLSALNDVEVLKKIKKNNGHTALFPLVNSADQGIGAMKLGTEHYIVRPYHLEEVKYVLDMYLARKHCDEIIEELRLQHVKRLEMSMALPTGKNMREVYNHAVEVAEERNNPVLIMGEVGTEKESMARVIHCRGSQFPFPLLFIDCRENCTDLLDAHLYGVKKGVDGHKGGLEKSYISEGGSVFLYAIEHLAKSNQVKVLKFLKSKKLGRRRAKKDLSVVKRIIAATDVNLNMLVNKGKFNKELYQIISKYTVCIPPLRKRVKEIIPLTMHFIKDFNKKYGKKVKRLSPEVKHYLESYEWPGNVSELRNIIEHAVILSSSESISMNELEIKVNKKLMTLDTLLMNGSFLSLDEIVTLYVNTVLKKVKGNKSKAAKILKVSRNTLKKKSIAL